MPTDTKVASTLALRLRMCRRELREALFVATEGNPAVAVRLHELALSFADTGALITTTLRALEEVGHISVSETGAIQLTTVGLLATEQELLDC